MNVDGDPNVLVRLNNTNPGSAAFTVRNQTTVANCLQIRDDGSGTLYGDYDRAGTVVFNNADPGTNLILTKLQRAGVDRLLFMQDAGNAIAKVKAATTSWALRLEGDTVEFNTVSSAGTTRFLANGTEFAKLSVSSTTSTLEASGSGQDLVAKGDEVIFDTPNSSSGAVLNRFKWNTYERLNLSDDSTNYRVVFQSQTGTQNANRSIWLASGHDVVALLDRADDLSGTACNFEVRTGTSQTTLFEVKNNYKTTFYADDGFGSVVQATQIGGTGGGAAGNDGIVDVGGGTTLRGRVKIRARSSVTSAGILQLQDETGADWYVWVDSSSGLVRYDKTDPGTTATTGVGIGTKPPIVVKTANYTVLNTQCDTHFTNTGASGGITFTLPSATTGLRFLFVVTAAQSVTVSRGGTDTIYKDGTSGTSFNSSTIGAFISVVCVEATKWVVDRHYSF